MPGEFLTWFLHGPEGLPKLENPRASWKSWRVGLPPPLGVSLRDQLRLSICLGSPEAFCCKADIRDSKEELMIACESLDPFLSGSIAENFTSDGLSMWNGSEGSGSMPRDVLLDGLNAERGVRLGLLLSTRRRLEGLPSINLFRLRCHSVFTSKGSLVPLPRLARPSQGPSILRVGLKASTSAFTSSLRSLASFNQSVAECGKMLTKLLLGERDAGRERVEGFNGLSRVTSMVPAIPSTVSVGREVFQGRAVSVADRSVIRLRARLPLSERRAGLNTWLR